MNAHAIALRDAEYPPLLREIPSPPKELWRSGIPLECGPSLAVVGTRRATRYGLETAFWLAKELAGAGITVVSGLAKGIDAAAHRGALAAGGRTVAVLGCGLDVCYPPHHKDLMRQIEQGGTVLTEYPPGTRPLPHHFPVRNRILAGMSLGTVLVEAAATGGAMITARLAMEFGREVFAVPGAVHSPVSVGPHQIVRDGARLVATAGQILEDLGMLPSAPPTEDQLPPDVLPEEARVLAALEPEPLLLDLVARRAGMPVSTAAAVLVKLELKSLVSRRAGGRYALAVGTGSGS
ncbi:MAG TPA: DNA-processing protein DprA [Actinomycetota bacterium]|nr:DNA-processing protein DprA [Actinomycetota bacterium]